MQTGQTDGREDNRRSDGPQKQVRRGEGSATAAIARRGCQPYEGTELSKRQAIRMLSPLILALRSKGYGWTAVAAMLSEHGVPVSGGGPANVFAGAFEKKRRPHRRGVHRSVWGGSSRRYPSAGTTGPACTLAIAHRGDAAGKETATTRSSRRVGHPTATRGRAPGTRREPEPRRSAFEVKPDTDDL